MLKDQFVPICGPHIASHEVLKTLKAEAEIKKALDQKIRISVSFAWTAKVNCNTSKSFKSH